MYHIILVTKLINIVATLHLKETIGAALLKIISAALLKIISAALSKFSLQLLFN